MPGRNDLSDGREADCPRCQNGDVCITHATANGGPMRLVALSTVGLRAEDAPYPPTRKGVEVPADRAERAEYIAGLERQMMDARGIAERAEERYNLACEQAERLRRDPDETARANCTSCRSRPGSIPFSGELLCSYCYRDALADSRLR